MIALAFAYLVLSVVAIVLGLALDGDRAAHRKTTQVMNALRHSVAIALAIVVLL